jgi:hypothetical protein
MMMMMVPMTPSSLEITDAVSSRVHVCVSACVPRTTHCPIHDETRHE